MTRETAEKLAQEAGFEKKGFFPASGLRFLQAVREMCAAGKCGHYGRTWTCPPAIGSLEDIAAECVRFNTGILLQTTAYMEDAFDAETMVEAMETQKNNFRKYVKLIRTEYPEEDILPMSSGGCGLCESCTYPDAPCRFPSEAVPSMEAYGLMVNDVCKLAGMPYYYGKDTITFSACVLFNEG